MEQIITAILNDPEKRSPEAIEAILVEQADGGEPWF